jgi:LPXTG-motif cell wall-anchored protein
MTAVPASSGTLLDVTITCGPTGAGDTFNVTLDTGATLGPITLGSSGAGTATFVLPAGTTGCHVVTATDSAGTTLSSSFCVAAAATSVPASSGLPTTGADIAGYTTAGAVAVGAGGLLVLASRRRRGRS